MPSTATDRLNGLTTSVAVKSPVRAVTSANIALSGLQTIGGIALTEDDRVLVKDQTDTTENGIYLASTSDWTRAKDFDGNRDAVKGTLVVTDGVSTALLFYRLTTADPVIIGTSAITFVQASEVQDPYPRTSAEIAAGVTPVDFGYPTGYVERYGTNAVPGTTDMASAIQAAVNVAKQGTGGNTVYLDPTTIYAVGSTIEINSNKPVNFFSRMVTPEGGVGGYIKPIANLANGIIRYRHSSRAGIGGVIQGINFYDPTSGGRNYSVEACIVADDFGSGKIIDCAFEYIKGSAIRTDNWTFGDIVRPRIRLCGNTNKPALNIGIPGSGFATQSLTISDMISEVNYLAPYTRINGSDSAYAIKIVNPRYESDTAVADTCQIYEEINNFQVLTTGGHYFRNTNTSIKLTAGATVTNALINNDNADGKPKIDASTQGAVLDTIKLLGGNTNTGYDIVLGAVGTPSYSTVNNINLSGAGIIDYGYGVLDNIHLGGMYDYASPPSGKYALVLGDASFPSIASNISIDSVEPNNHGVSLAGTKSRLTAAYIKDVSGTGVGITAVADIDIDGVTFNNVTNKFSVANTDPDSTRIKNYSGYEKAGVATITNPATTVVVSHGAEFTPTLRQIRVSPGASHTWWISTITSTQFTINVSTTPGSSTDFGWRVTY